MSDAFKLLATPTFMTNLAHNATTIVSDPGFLIQAAIIATAGILSFWLRALVRPRVQKFIDNALPPSWAQAWRRGAETTELPLIWLSLMWFALIGAEMAGAKDSLLDATVELLAAWISIRLLSLSVKSAAASVALSVTVWAIAALNILGILDTVVHHLEVSALHIGKYRLSAMMVLHAILALGVLLWLTTQLFRFLSRQIDRASSLTPSIKVLLTQVLQIALPTLAVAIGLSAAGVNLTALTVISGAVFLGIGLGLQKLVGNLVAGLTLLIGKSIKPGDVIAYKDGLGQVTEMGARYVTLRRIDGAEILIPNEFFLENGVENWTYTNPRIGLSVTVGISYDADPRAAQTLMVDAAKTAERVLPAPAPLAVVKAFGDNAIEMEVYFSIDDPMNGTAVVKSEIMLGILDRFRAAGIAIPYPQHDVRVISMPDKG